MAISLDERRRRAEEERKKRGLPPTQPTPAPAPTTYTDPKTGKETGFEYGGKTYYGLSPSEKELFLQQQEGIAAQFPATQRFTEQQQEAIKQKQIKEQQQALEQPERRQLEPAYREGEVTPIVGGIIKTYTNVMLDKMKAGKYIPEKTRKYLEEEEKKYGEVAPEILHNTLLTEIEKKVYEEGITESQKFGMYIEGIPILGGLVGKYGGGLIETPRSDIDQVRKTIKKQKTRMTKYETWVRNGVIDQQTAMNRANVMEANLQAYESRIKLLINYSPSLVFESDVINTIEEEILTNKEILTEVKGRIYQMQGQQVTPSDWELMFALESFDEEEE